jgi:hypothetical protein
MGNGMNEVNSQLEPGMFVRNPAQPEWGVGQVQSNVAGRVTVMFEHAGKVVVDSRNVELEMVFGL